MLLFQYFYIAKCLKYSSSFLVTLNSPFSLAVEQRVKYDRQDIDQQLLTMLIRINPLNNLQGG